MTKRILLATPVVLVLIWSSYVVFQDWDKLNLMHVGLFFVGIIAGIYFVFMQLTHRFIDVTDFCQVKEINIENMTAFRNQRRAYFVIMSVLFINDTNLKKRILKSTKIEKYLSYI